MNYVITLKAHIILASEERYMDNEHHVTCLRRHRVKAQAGPVYGPGRLGAAEGAYL